MPHSKIKGFTHWPCLVLLPGGDKHSRHIRENRMRRKQL